LHAAKITFAHPSTTTSMTFEAPLPADFANVIVALRSPGGITTTPPRSSP
jgi:hypothetical protein